MPVTKVHADLHADKLLITLDEDGRFLKQMRKSEMHSENGNCEFTMAKK